jgi:hypothetical protein
MKTDRIEIRIEPEIKNALMDLAKKEGCKLSKLVSNVLKKYVHGRNKMIKIIVCLFSVISVGCSSYIITQDTYGPQTWGRAHAIASIMNENGYNFQKSNERIIIINDDIDNQINFVKLGDDDSTVVVFKGKISGQYSQKDISKMIQLRREFISDYFSQ